MVESARLESVYGGNVIAGSNPALSADREAAKVRSPRERARRAH